MRTVPFVPVGVGIPSCLHTCDGQMCPAAMLRRQGVFLIIYRDLPWLHFTRN